jgi:hypothetical protein
MVREGAPSTACSADHEKNVGGAPSRTMTISNDSAALAAVILDRP